MLQRTHRTLSKLSGVDLSPNVEQTLDSPVDHRKGPRRRGEELEHAILKAALEELTETGYSALTMDRIAARARTSKAALYRRWPSRADLVIEACRTQGLTTLEVPDTGELRADVLALLRQMAAKMDSPLGGVLRGLLAELTRDEEFARLVRERIHTAGPTAIGAILARAVERGEVEPRIPGSRRALVATDLIRNQFLLYGAPVDDAAIVEIVDEVYLPLVRIGG
ncbi:TetR/AcrR family transcriptional regulator [Amycolatopsis saalfeldensis]|uniref:DNA-binding transcriptional regulator, AcrR family n=1 Tax=Amycolatopsis saalfeldensis TaxID=394193 RepID=A0A1H8XHD4_9PSEU|nr:TetR/AcrR family transcriptional regulator [Amycolatopsis saalfeldensis]SEP39157.1 DNA-binding transcriptional regulator, AcrR family [Amycolatopsis saalfeldensis]